mgnify:CR=1 FL=1
MAGIASRRRSQACRRCSFQLSAGILYGYKEPYEDKVPFNHHGVSPGAVGAVGWEFTRAFSAQINVLGDSAFMLQLSFDLH